MQKITLPEKPIIKNQEDNFAVFEIKSCYPGYGATIGNALRRVLLSSLSGAAITSVKITGANHEFSTIPGILEDVVEIILNLKKIKFKIHVDGPVKLSLKVNKEGRVTARDIKENSDVEISNKDAFIATVTDKNRTLEMELKVETGIGYMPIEQQGEEKLEIGNIAIDAVFTPVRKVNYRIENMRVGKMTNYDRLVLEIETDGSITPEEAFKSATLLLVEHFNLFGEVINQEQQDLIEAGDVDEKEVAFKKAEIERKESEKKEKEERKEQNKEEQEDVLKMSVNDINLSVRVAKILSENKIKSVGKIIKKTEDDLQSLPGMGDKAVKDIKKSLGKFGLTLKK
ncbi:DNA-directed RNA polymerase subunit alpha [Patescibacteria group bacterium]|nr:DNA-directed RNA polymerase subunit alpha [Patescibacteria group bacterium]